MSQDDPFPLSARELQALASAAGLPSLPHQERGELLAQWLHHRLAEGHDVMVDGVFERVSEGFGFVRSPHHDFTETAADAFVSPSQVRALNLKSGHRLRGPIRGPKGTERFFALLHVDRCNGAEPERIGARVDASALQPIVPHAPLSLGEPTPLAAALHALAPWQHGQRILVHAPAETSAAPLLATLALGLAAAEPALRTHVLLVGERPETIAAVRTRLAAQPAIECIATAFDALPSQHVRIAQLVLAEAQRELEAGERTVLLVGGLDALVRAHQLDQPASGRWLCPGLDAQALHGPRALFAAARATAEGGALTVFGSVTPAADHPADLAIAHAFRAVANSLVVVDAERWHAGHEVPIDLATTVTRPEDDPRPLAVRQAARAAARR